VAAEAAAAVMVALVVVRVVIVPHGIAKLLAEVPHLSLSFLLPRECLIL